MMMELTFRIKKDESTIKQYLTNAELFVSVHPLIYKMEHVGQHRYKVFEEVKVGFVTCRFAYPASVIQGDNGVTINATVFGLAKISMDFTFLNDGDFTLVNEKVIVKSALPIKNFIYALFEKQHGILFANIERV